MALTRLRERLAGLWAGLAGRGALALVDQAAVSGARLAASVLVGRGLGADGLGTYTLAFTAVVLAETLLEALVTIPYTVFSQRSDVRPGALGNAFGQAMGLAALVAVAVALGGAWALVGGNAGLGTVLFVVALIMPVRLALEFARRVAFAEHRVGVALALDVAMASVLVGGLAAALWTDRLTVVAAYGIYGLACGLPVAAWAVIRRRDLAPQCAAARADAAEAWRFGRWIAGSRLALAGRETAMPWLLASLAGTASTGLFDAAGKVVGLTTPLLSGLSNVLTPAIAAAFTRGGARDVRRVVWRATGALAGAVAVVAAVLGVAGGPVLVLLYGDAFAGQGVVVAAFAVSMVAEAAGIPADAGLWAIGRPNVGFVVHVAGFVSAVASGLALIPSFGVVGAVAGLAVGKTLASVLQVALFARYSAETA